DGSKRRLGSWTEAAWSPHGLFVVGAHADELAALEPAGGAERWTLGRPDVASPRWGGTRTDTRIAYLSGGRLRVVAGDGTGDREIGPARAVAPVWRPESHVVAYRARAAAGAPDPGSARACLRSRRPARAPALTRDRRRVRRRGADGLRVADAARRARVVARRQLARDRDPGRRPARLRRAARRSC